MNKKILKIGGIVSASFIVGFMFAPTEITKEIQPTVTVTETPEPVVITKVSTSEPEPAVTVTATPEVGLDNGTNPVVSWSEHCDKAFDIALNISEDISPIAQTMGDQKNIMSMARESLTGSQFIDMGRVMRDQSELDQSLAGNYTRLAASDEALTIALEKCKQSQE